MVLCIYIISEIVYTMLTTCVDMKLGEIENVAERETLIEPLYKRIDKHGRIYIDVGLANQEALILVVKPIPKDKIDFIRVGRRS